eukprot:c48477_g1_i1 orf=26-229(+)
MSHNAQKTSLRERKKTKFHNLCFKEDQTACYIQGKASLDTALRRILFVMYLEERQDFRETKVSSLLC